VAGIPVRLKCSCGAVGACPTDEPTWACQACGLRWRPEHSALEAVGRAVGDLSGVRRRITAVLIATVIVAAALVAIHPAWLLGVPLLVGGVLTAVQPTYRKRRQRALTTLRSGIPLSRV